MRFTIPDMDCDGCFASITRAVPKLDAIGCTSVQAACTSVQAG